MRTLVLIGILLVLGSVACESAAQSGCPTPGTRLTFSDGGRIEAVSDEGNYVCRFKSTKTEKTFDRYFGAFAPTGPNAEQIRTLAPFQVGHKVSFTSAGADVLGGDGFWFSDVSIERFEKVLTPAGTFDAYVILHDQRELSGSHGEWQRRYWYAPEVSHVVKFEFLTLHGSPPPNYPKDWELTAYAPVTPTASNRVRVPSFASDPTSEAVAAPAAAQEPPKIPVVAPAPAPEPAKVAAAAPAATTSEMTKVAAAVLTPGAQDGTWRMEMALTTTYGTTVGGECPAQTGIRLTFIDGTAKGPSSNLNLTKTGEISGWMQVPPLGTSMLPFIVNVSGHFENGVFTGSVSGRCLGSFTMRKQ